MTWVPSGNDGGDDTVRTPLPSMFCKPPRRMPLSLNCMPPVGVPIPGVTAVTVAVNATPWPTIEGLSDEETATDAPALFTV